MRKGSRQLAQVIGSFFMVCLFSTEGVGKLPLTVDDVLPGCRNVIDKNSAPLATDMMAMAYCLGIVDTLNALLTPGNVTPNVTVCLPPNVSIAQEIAVIIRHADTLPPEMRLSFAAAATFALHKAWPCR